MNHIYTIILHCFTCSVFILGCSQAPSFQYGHSNSTTSQAIASELSEQMRLDQKFLEACGKGDIEKAKSLKIAGANINAQRDIDGSTGLMLAIEEGHSAMAKHLIIEAGVDINIERDWSFSRNTVLSIAISHEDLEIIRLLFERGVKIGGKKMQGHLVTQAIWTNNLKIVQELINHHCKVSETPILIASCIAGHKGIFDLLLTHGADVNAKTGDNNTPLIWAAEKGYTEMVKALLEKGAEMDHQNNEDNTALMLAAREGHKDIVELLLKKGADPNIPSRNGNTAATIAARNRHEKIEKALLRSFRRPWYARWLYCTAVQ